MKPVPKPKSKSERLRETTFASGGSKKMFSKQAADRLPRPYRQDSNFGTGGEACDRWQGPPGRWHL